MPIVKMPDGTQVRFPDDMPREQIRDMIASKFPDAARQVPATPVAPQTDGAMGVVQQGLSGVNEGAASLLSLPNTLEMGLRSIGPGIGNAFGGNFAMPQESWLPDAGAKFRNASTEIGAIKPETDDAGGQFARRVGQEIGANILPAMGSPAKIVSLLSSAGSGVGAATANLVAPDNPAAEIIGQLLGGGVPLGIANQAERMGMSKAAPSLDDLRASKSAAYAAVDNLGAQYSPQAVDDLLLRMKAAGAKINPMRHPKANSLLEEMGELSGQPQTLTQLDELRQVIKRDLIDGPDGGERHWGKEFQSTLDDFIGNAQPGQMAAGDPVAATTAINNARALNSRYKKVEDFERQMTKADNATSASGSGGNLNNQIRQKARQILDNPKRTRGYSEQELAALQKVVAPGRGEDILRGIGKIAPGGNGLMTALNTGAIVHNPAMAAIPALAQIAKTVADRGTVNRAEILKALLANGAKTEVPFIAPETAKVAAALMAGQAANQNNPTTDEIARLLALN